MNINKEQFERHIEMREEEISRQIRHLEREIKGKDKRLDIIR